jgi:hypothetical protein
MFAFVYGKKKFNIGLTRYFLSRLNTMIEKFITVEFDTNEKEALILCKFFKERNVEKYYSEKIKKLESNISKNKIADYNQLAIHIGIQETIGAFYSNNLNKYLKYINESDELIEHDINEFFVLSKIKQICAAENLKMISGINKTIFLSNKTIEIIEKENSFKKNILIKTYFQIYKSFIDKDSDIIELYTLINKNKSKINKEELKSILAYAQNFCLRQINKGKIELQTTLLEIYKISIESGVINENNKISESNYNNIIFLGLRLKEYDWTLAFLKKHIFYIPIDKKDNTYNFNMARYYFFQKQYDKALVALREVELNDIFYGLDVRSLLLKIYYETSEREAFYNLLISFRIFIKRKKLVAPSRQKAYSNMMKYAKKIMLISFKNKAKMEQLNKEIQTLNPCADKGWLIEKISEKINYKTQ